MMCSSSVCLCAPHRLWSLGASAYRVRGASRGVCQQRKPPATDISIRRGWPATHTASRNDCHPAAVTVTRSACQPQTLVAAEIAGHRHCQPQWLRLPRVLTTMTANRSGFQLL